MEKPRLQAGGNKAAGWELASLPVPPHLVPYVDTWVGYQEWSPSPVHRVEHPSGRSVLILEWGPPLAVMDNAGAYQKRSGGFLAGTDDTSSATTFAGMQTGVQVNLTPLGAYALAAAPMHLLARRVLSLQEAGVDRTLPERLAHARDWSERFALVVAFVERRVLGKAGLSWVVSHALARMDAAHGAVRVAFLARELGVTRKHLHHLFEEQVGISPKRYADVRRFHHLRQHLAAGGPDGLAQTAAALGYVDQAHMARDARRFAQATAGQLKLALQDPLVRAIDGLTKGFNAPPA